MKNILYTLSLALILTGCSDNKVTLHVYSWADYIPPETIDEFENRYNCNLCIDTFDSNEGMYAKLKAGASGYDICFPSSYMVQQMINEDMIEKLDKTQITNVTENFDHSFDSQIIDPEMTYSVPYAVTYTGFMYLKDKVDCSNMSWDILKNEKLSQKISLLEDIREVVGAGLMYNGFSINSENEAEIKKAVETVKIWKKNIRKFDAEAYKLEVSNKSLYLGHAYSSDAFQIIVGDEEGGSRDDIGFGFPKEGFTIAFDEMVILKNSVNKDLAYKFINFIYEKENSLNIMIYNVAPVPNKKSIQELPENLRNSIIISQDILKNGQILKPFKNPNTMEMYSKAWDEIKSLK